MSAGPWPPKAKPITPAEAAIEAEKIKRNKIPPEVIRVFNQLIAENYDPSGRGTVIFQDLAVDRIVAAVTETDGGGQEMIRQRIFDGHWLDIETIFRDAGWNVAYEQPAYNESFEPKFIFTAATSQRD